MDPPSPLVEDDGAVHVQSWVRVFDVALGFQVFRAHLLHLAAAKLPFSSRPRRGGRDDLLVKLVREISVFVEVHRPEVDVDQCSIEGHAHTKIATIQCKYIDNKTPNLKNTTLSDTSSSGGRK